MSKNTSLKNIFSIFVIMFIVSANTVFAGQEVTRFSFPSIKDDFCGVVMNFQYCKCAFHNDYCDIIAMPSESANTYVWNEYREWVRKRINTMGASCVVSGGIWKTSNRSCTICTDPDVNIDGKCQKLDEERTEESDAGLPDGPFNKDCTVTNDFENDWQKYSDIDERLGETEKSYEAQQYAGLIEQIVEKKAEVYNYKVEMETDRLARLELRNIHEALVKNIKVNLLKSFWRLSYITYTTIKSGISTGNTYIDMLEPETAIQGLAKGIAVIQAHVPSDSTLAIDTSTAKGKVKSIGANAALEAMDSLGNPLKIATKVFDDSVKSTFPSADITPEEIEILKNQYLRNRNIDMIIQESYLINSQRRANVLELEQEIVVLQMQAQSWKDKEKARVQDSLEQNCREQRDKK